MKSRRHHYPPTAPSDGTRKLCLVIATFVWWVCLNGSLEQFTQMVNSDEIYMFYNIMKNAESRSTIAWHNWFDPLSCLREGMNHVTP